MKDPNRFCLNRREFLAGTAALAAAAMLPRGLRAATYEPMPTLGGYKPKVVGYWVAKGEHEKTYAEFKKMVEAATDFKWLSRGERVMLKLAMNSGTEFPRTTDPWALDSMIRVLKEKGAKVVVGDSAGCGHVRWTPDDKKGSSRQLCEKLGLLKIANENGAESVFFEEKGYDSFFEASPAGSNHWKKPIRVTSAVKEVEHIIYLPRVSAHSLADFTGGLKVGVGFLREDSRLAFHEGAENFAAMFEEINQVPEIASKLRLTVSSGRSVTSLLGPDLGPVVTPDYGLFFASTDLLAHDLLSYSWVKWNREYMTAPADHIKEGILTRARAERNKGFLKNMWKLPEGHVTPDLVFFQAGTTGSVYDHPAIVNFMQRKGGRPDKVRFEQLNKHPVKAVPNYLLKEMTV
ncbi:MAG TPA: DUF362 domain-containing protein [Thermodesulfobacteriota bacterium]|nr:DUF362 domain-containing protein [Thermodesulfobacteriota bacterium]